MSSRRCCPPSRGNSSIAALDQSQSASTVNSCSSSGRARLYDLPIDEDLTLLRRRDLEIGKLLGRGRYSEVQCIERIHTTTTTTTTTTSDDSSNSNNSKNTLNPNGRYVMKHIQNKLFASGRSQRKWQRDLTNAMADLVTEAMYLSKLNHPHIIPLRALTRGGTSVLRQPGAIGEDYFLILDRMEETLNQRIHQKWKSQGPQSLSMIRTKTRYALQATSALTYLHDHQIMYRDFKPDNIGFVQRSGEDCLQLFDFGLARELDEPPSTNKVYSLSASGTRRYMAPEIFSGKGRYNYKADVFSWALVYYECLACLKPFEDFTTQLHEELVCRLGGRPKLGEIEWPDDCSELSQQVESLLHEAWHQDGSQRPSMAQVGQRLQEILQRSAQAQHFFANGDPPEAVNLFIQKKTSTSELTVATDPMASDSEFDCLELADHSNKRWSQLSSSSNPRSSVGSLGGTSALTSSDC